MDGRLQTAPRAWDCNLHLGWTTKYVAHSTRLACAPSAELDALMVKDWDQAPRARGFTGHEHLDRSGFTSSGDTYWFDVGLLPYDRFYGSGGGGSSAIGQPSNGAEPGAGETDVDSGGF